MVILEAHVPIWGHSCSNYILYIYNLVGGLEHFLFFHILGIVIPPDYILFFRGVETTNQVDLKPLGGCISHCTYVGSKITRSEAEARKGSLGCDCDDARQASESDALQLLHGSKLSTHQNWLVPKFESIVWVRQVLLSRKLCTGPSEPNFDPQWQKACCVLRSAHSPDRSKSLDQDEKDDYPLVI